MPRGDREGVGHSRGSPDNDATQSCSVFQGSEGQNADGEAFNAEWSVRSHPVIVAFITATNYTLPVSDKTKCCAAFMNWCLMRANRPRTHRVRSGSFRCFSDPAIIPAAGDIAVLKNRGDDEQCSGSSHAAFWLGRAGVIEWKGLPRPEVATEAASWHQSAMLAATQPAKGKSMTIVTVGIDLAKNVFAIHGVDQAGKAVLVKPKGSRDQLVPLIAQLPPCLIGMEACSGAR